MRKREREKEKFILLSSIQSRDDAIKGSTKERERVRESIGESAYAY